MDVDQNIFSVFNKIKQNRRNTVEIINHLKGFISKEIAYLISAVQGEPVRIIKYSAQMNKNDKYHRCFNLSNLALKNYQFENGVNSLKFYKTQVY